MRLLAGSTVSEQKPSSTQEFERLRERVMAASETPEPVKTTQEEPKKRQIPQLATRRQGVVAAGIAAGLLLGVLAVRYPVKVPKIPFNFSFSGSAAANSAPPSSPNAPANSTPAASAAASPATAKAKQAGEPLERPRQNAKATTNQPAPVKTSEVSARNEKPAPRSTETASPDSAPGTDVPRPGLASRSLSPPTVRTEPVSVPPPVLQVAPAASGLSAGLPKASVAPPANGVYSPETPGVKPPMLVRPQMPREPQPGDDTGFFDMRVVRRGRERRPYQADFTPAALSRPHARGCGEGLEVQARDPERAACEIPAANPDHPDRHARIASIDRVLF